MNDFTTADAIAAYVGTGLIVLGVPVIGLIEMALGSGHPVGADGQIVHEAVVPIDLRSYIIIAGLLIWGLYAIYKVVATMPATPPADSV